MHTSKATGQKIEQSRHQWLQVCRTRGTPAPDQAQVARFLASLHEEAQATLDQALLLCLNGREKHRELEIVSWAAACTRPDFVAKVQAHGLSHGGHDLFGAGLALMASGWDMSARVAQLASNPQDIDSLRTMLALQAPANHVDVKAEALRTAVARVPPSAAACPDPGQAAQLAPPEEPFEQFIPVWEYNAENYPPLAAADAIQPMPPSEALLGAASKEPGDPVLASLQKRQQVRLFGREAAHTLEIGPHRRGSSFMGVHVVTIESARALAGGGYDWSRKLAVQFTPEEMPAAIAVLMNLSSSARFGQHGAERDKFLELRRQEGGMVVVTGQAGSVYAVPVKTTNVYYLLTLFARAMAEGLPGGSVAEVLALVKASQ